MFYAFLLLAFVSSPVSAAGGGSPRGKWTVMDPNSQIPCITLYGQIDLDLSYYEDGTESEKDGHLTVPSTSTVNKQASSCNAQHQYGPTSVKSQVLQLDFDHLPGWSMQFIFSTDKRFQTNGNEWALIQVTVAANYTSKPDQFPNPAEPYHVYSSPVNIGGTTDLADYIYAHVLDSYYCPSQQKYIINNDPKKGPKATMTLSMLQLEAYNTNFHAPGPAPFGNKETCPTDQHVTDKVPLIVGGVLAGLVVLTTIIYVIYRACLPDEILNLVNPNSHHENKSMVWDEEEGSTHTSHGHDSHH